MSRSLTEMRPLGRRGTRCRGAIWPPPPGAWPSPPRWPQTFEPTGRSSRL